MQGRIVIIADTRERLSPGTLMGNKKRRVSLLLADQINNIEYINTGLI